VAAYDTDERVALSFENPCDAFGPDAGRQRQERQKDPHQ